jgi:hypothetical protein
MATKAVRSFVAFAIASIAAGLVACTGRADPRLEAAWRFACAITNDAKDRALCQERVARAHLERGEVDLALHRARAIEDWRKPAVLADIATHCLRAGDRGRAQPVLAEARTLGAAVTNWPFDRVLLHVTQAEVLAGNLDGAHEIRVRYDLNPEHRGRADAYFALALLLSGRTDEALRTLDMLPGERRYEDFQWQTEGYLLIANAGRLGAAEASNVLERAWTSCETIPGWKKWEQRLDVIDSLRANGLTSAMTGRLEYVTTNVATLGLPGHIKAPLMARVALGWARAGRAGPVAELARAAQPLIETDSQPIEQPSAWAAFVEAAAVAGDRALARDLLGRAVGTAAGLENLRPRAMACVDIALAAARGGFDEPSVRSGLRRLMATFHDG